MGCLVVALTAAMLTCAVGELIKVGGKYGWTQNVNYTQWAAHQSFGVGDWLFHVKELVPSPNPSLSYKTNRASSETIGTRIMFVPLFFAIALFSNFVLKLL
ncbi:hypothetical protein BUALT_Bualt04G0141200 [Buddleja alternifolia]|uniref:Phytocyanin domain-containing protein n=1 Tax=Buddleja alternifolia TaxID=168488 RepID=A0AAV6XVM9_9LAMI|nr:hypothetical protein BUALT_Bualt04G0141200 [Buddleja alternifolia]